MKKILIRLCIAVLIAGLIVLGLFLAGKYMYPQVAETPQAEESTNGSSSSAIETYVPEPKPAPKFKIKLFAGDATPSPAAIKVRYGKKIKKLPEPERTGYEFIGWFTERTGGSEIKNGDVMDFARNIDAYARWKKTSIGEDRSVRGLPVLMYHQFYDPAQGEEPKAGLAGNYMLSSDFDEQIHYLAEEKFYFPSWDEVYAFVNGEIDLPENSVVITIDDGAKSFYKYAIPTLEKYRVPGTGFIIANKVKKKTVERYASDIISMQSHTYGMHEGGSDGQGLITTIDGMSGIEDLEKAANILGTKDALAYPFGHHNERAEEMLEEVGIHMAFTTAYGRVYPGMNPLVLPRVRMIAGISLSAFAAQLNIN